MKELFDGTLPLLPLHLLSEGTPLFSAEDDQLYINCQLPSSIGMVT
jgi:hypothetical protein